MMALIALLVTLLAPLAAVPRPAVQTQFGESSGQDGGQRTGSTSVVSPSVLATFSGRREPGDLLTVDILILWRGSPGWSYRRTGLGGSMTSSGGASGPINFAIQEGGLLLTASFDSAAHVLTILGETVPLNDANVVFVDRVDSPDGPVIVGTTTVAPRRVALTLGALLRETPELLAYLRCEAQLPEPINRSAMNDVCLESVLRGLVTAPVTVTPVPEGPVINRAAATAPPARPGPPIRPPGSSEGSSASAVVSPVVFAGWFTSGDGAGAVRMDLLVLWRGSLGWATHGQSSGGSGGGTGRGRRGMTVRRGGLSLYAAIDVTNPAARTAQIEDATIPLGDHNVVLVDEVDAATGPRVVKTLRVDPRLNEPRQIEAVIARLPELVQYLRCDLKLTDARQQTTMDAICARFGGR